MSEQKPVGWASRDILTGDMKVLWAEPTPGPLYAAPVPAITAEHEDPRMSLEHERKLYGALAPALSAEQKPIGYLCEWAEAGTDASRVEFIFEPHNGVYDKVTPLYAAPVPAITAEQKAEVLRLAVDMAHTGITVPLVNYLNKIGGQ